MIIQVGHFVWMEKFKRIGKVVSIREDKLIVQVTGCSNIMVSREDAEFVEDVEDNFGLRSVGKKGKM